MKRPVVLGLVAGLFLAVACSGTGASNDDGGTGNAGGTEGTAGSDGVGGSEAAGASGSGTAGAAGGFDPTGGAAGTTPADGGVQDAKPDVPDGACTTEPKGPGPIPHTCVPQAASECDGKSDSNPALPNGKTGNGFDDDCDGQVDEGCDCDAEHPAGTTKDCYLVPASQVDPTTKLPVGWCKENAKGTMACVSNGGGEFGGSSWDGYCKGAQFPFATDACGPGDFDCDGVDQNPQDEDCSCKPVTVTCPGEPVVISPYPDPTNLEKKKPSDPKPTEPFVVDGWKWISDNQGPNATGWTWTLTGGDCDNILPHTTFGVFNGKNTKTSKRVGTEQKNLGSNKKQKGIVVGPANDAHQIWPAFSLSGDYVVKGEFDLQGKHYECTTKVQVRAPGLRAEMCWDMSKGAAGGLSSTDLDLHFSRLQGTSCAGKHGWFDSCGEAPSSDDCYFTCESGCRTGNTGFCSFLTPGAKPGWGYAASGTDACHGWGSLREPQQTCDNPRLDRDNLGCNTTIIDPTNPGGLDNPLTAFCGPENINLDNPKAGDAFLVGVHYYGGSIAIIPHVNVYCNGERKLSVGYDPTTIPVTAFPVMKQGFDPPSMSMTPIPVTGDFWEVARIAWSGDPKSPCVIEPVPSKAPKADKDGTVALCVDTNAQNKASTTTSDLWLFTPGGGAPASVGAACWH